MKNEKNKKARVPPPGNHMRSMEIDIGGRTVKLTPKQKAFAESYAATNELRKSAIAAGYTEKGAQVMARDTLSKPYVRAYVDYLRQKTTTKKVLSAIERKEILSQMATDGSLSAKDRRAAIDVLNKMTGEYATKVEVGGEFKVNEEVKQETKVTVTNPFDGLSTEELIKLANLQ